MACKEAGVPDLKQVISCRYTDCRSRIETSIHFGKSRAMAFNALSLRQSGSRAPCSESSDTIGCGNQPNFVLARNRLHTSQPKATDLSDHIVAEILAYPVRSSVRMSRGKVGPRHADHALLGPASWSIVKRLT